MTLKSKPVQTKLGILMKSEGSIGIILALLMCLFLMTSCSKFAKNENQKDGGQKAIASKSGTDYYDHSEEQEQPQLVMKLFVNLGMDDYYRVLDLTGNTVTYSYYNYENSDAPELDQKTVPFDEILKVENDVRQFLMFMYLIDESNEIKLDMSDDFINQVENNPDFRENLGKVLNKPFNMKLLNNTITPQDIEEAVCSAPRCQDTISKILSYIFLPSFVSF